MTKKHLILITGKMNELIVILHVASLAIKVKVFRFMVFSATFNDIFAILLWSVLLMEEIGVPEDNY